MDASGRRRVRRLNFDLHVHHITSASNNAAHTLAVAIAILPSSIVPKSSSSRTKSIGGGGIGGGGGGDVGGVDEDDPAGAAAASTAAVASVLNVVSFAESTPGIFSSSAIGSTADSDFTTSTPFAFSEFTAADSLLSLTVDELNTSSTSYVVAESRRRPDDAAVATHAPSTWLHVSFRERARARRGLVTRLLLHRDFPHLLAGNRRIRQELGLLLHTLVGDVTQQRVAGRLRGGLECRQALSVLAVILRDPGGSRTLTRLAAPNAGCFFGVITAVADAIRRSRVIAGGLCRARRARAADDVLVRCTRARRHGTACAGRSPRTRLARFPVPILVGGAVHGCTGRGIRQRSTVARPRSTQDIAFVARRLTRCALGEGVGARGRDAVWDVTRSVAGRTSSTLETRPIRG